MKVYEFSIVEPGADIGEGTRVCSFCYVEAGAKIGERCTLKNGVQVWRGVIIGSDVFIGPNATFTNDKYPRAGHRTEPEITHIADFVTIGANATILPGVWIGEGAFIAAGAVVTRDVDPGVLVAGNPARKIGYWDRRVGKPIYE